jgi:hypothetical protein
LTGFLSYCPPRTLFQRLLLLLSCRLLPWTLRKANLWEAKNRFRQ